MKKSLLLLLFSFYILLAGCGGGGGGEGGSASSSITYSGNTTEATVSSNNAEEISTVAYQGGAFGSTMNLNGSAEAEKIAAGHSLPLNLSKILNEAISKIDLSSENSSMHNAIKSASGSLPGNCGGNASYSISYDDQTGDFSGSMAFNSYCAAGATLSGSTGFAGRISMTTGKFLTISLSINAITAVSGSESMTVKGSMQYSYASTPYTVTYNVVVKDNVSSKIFWWNNLTLRITDGSGYEDLALSGRIYHPDYGYVTISTPTLFRFYDADVTPSSGVLLLTGETGTSGDSTSARLTVLSTTTYHIQADTNGDGVYDWDSGTLNW